MAKVKKIEQCKHPNSRKTKSLAKQIQKAKTRDKSKQFSNLKLNLLGEKILWFKEHLKPEWNNICEPNDVLELIQTYISRFDEELNQIQIKHSIGNRKNRQHGNREDIIKLTIKNELEEFNTCGFEMPDLLNKSQFELLKTWNGELKYIQKFKLKRFSKSYLEQEQNKLQINMQ